MWGVWNEKEYTYLKVHCLLCMIILYKLNNSVVLLKVFIFQKEGLHWNGTFELHDRPHMYAISSKYGCKDSKFLFTESLFLLRCIARTHQQIFILTYHLCKSSPKPPILLISSQVWIVKKTICLQIVNVD